MLYFVTIMHQEFTVLSNNLFFWKFFLQNNVVGHFATLQQHLVSESYSSEDLMVVACPTPEQVSVILSSASLLAAGS